MKEGLPAGASRSSRGGALWPSSGRSGALFGLVTQIVLITATACSNDLLPPPDDDEETAFPAIQEGNEQPMLPLVPRPSSELMDNRLGAHLYPNGLWIEITHAYDPIRDEILERGVKRLHTSLFEVEPPIEWEASEHEIPADYDRLIDEMAENGVAVDYLLHFWDKEGQGEALSTPRFEDSEQVEDFLEYVRLIVQHFEGRVQYYTIWSEPDNCGEGGIKCIEAQDYVALARQVIPVIREEDSQAKVALAPVVLFFAQDYLFTVLESDVAAMFDVVQWHGQYSVVPDDAFYGSYYYDYRAIVEQIKEAAAEHGFSGEYWSTEMGWCTADESPTCGNPDHPWGTVDTDKKAAKYYARGIVMHLGLDVAVGVGGGIGEWRGPWSYSTRGRLNTIMAGATPSTLPVIIEGAADIERLESFGFTLPDGGRLFALWTDGTAVELDPGRSVTLTFADVSGNVFGLDVLHGLEQQLVTETISGDLVVRDLLVRDYPLILRLES